MMNAAIRTKAEDLKPGDVIPPPTHERGWLWKDGVKRMMTVRKVDYSQPDKRGRIWLLITADFTCPYRGHETVMDFRMRPDSLVSVQN